MFLFFTTVASEFDASGKDYKEMYNEALAAGKEATKILMETATSIEDSAIKTQRSLTNIALTPEMAQKFRNELKGVFQATLDIGGSFKDVTEVVSSFSDGVKSVVMPSTQIMTKMVEFGKATGIANAEVGKMFGEFTKFNFNQQKSIDLIEKLTTKSRIAGLDAKEVINEVQTNLVKVDSLGFRKGVDGLSKMAMEAKALKVSITDIGAMSLSQTLWDPKKAMELTQKMQMYGGAVGKLGDFHQVFRMGAYDAGELQNEMTKLTAQAFKFNKETGEFETTFASRQLLKVQAEALDMNVDKAFEIGRQKAKQLQIEEELLKNAKISAQIKSGKISDEQMKLITSLTEFKKDATGKMVMSLNIPGMDEITDLEATMKSSPESIAKQLDDYQKQAKMSDRQIAEKNMSINEKQARDVKSIHDMVFLTLDKTQQDELVKIAEDVRKASNTMGQSLTTASSTPAYLALQQYRSSADPKREAEEANAIAAERTRRGRITEDYFSSGSGGGEKEIYGSEGEFKTRLIGKDDIMAAPNLGQIFEKLSKFYTVTKQNFSNAVKNFNPEPVEANISISKSKPITQIDLSPLNKLVDLLEKNQKSENTTSKLEISPLEIKITMDGLPSNVSKLLDDPKMMKDLKGKIGPMIVQKVSEMKTKTFQAQKGRTS